MADSKAKTFDKRVVFQENTDQHARLINRLRYDDLTQADFFRLMISGYIRGDERILNYLDESKTQSKARKLKSRKLREKGRQNMIDTGLSDDQIDNLFDMIAEEFPDL